MKKPIAKQLKSDFDDLRHGQPVLLVEYCSGCENHNNSLRHDPEKYARKALEMKAAVQREFPFFKIVLRPLDTTRPESINRLGLFEVSMASHELQGPKLLGSKLKTLLWPEPRTVVSNIRATFPSRQLVVTLELPKELEFHPENQFAADLRTVLLSEYDEPQFRSRLQGQKTSPKEINSKRASARPRMLSGIVQKKIQSGVVKQDEIDELVKPKTHIFEQKTNGELELDWNVKPGLYKFMVLNDGNFEQVTSEILVLPAFRVKEGPVTMKVALVAQKLANLTLSVEAPTNNPLFNIHFHKHVENTTYSQADEDLVRVKVAALDGGKTVEKYQVSALKPGIYRLNCEFKDYQTFSETVQVYRGVNTLRLCYPGLKLEYHTAGQPGQEADGQKSKNTHREADSRREQAEEDQAESSVIRGLKERKNTKTMPESTAKKSSKKPLISDKENVKNSAKNDPNDRPMSRPTHDADRAEADERPPFQKQRGASGNRIRPGERLYSAKSKSNQPTNDDTSKNSIISQQTADKYKSDALYQAFEKSIEPESLNIFMPINDHFKIDFEFLFDQAGSMDEQSQSKFYNEDSIDNRFEHHCLRHTPQYEFGRICVERLTAKLEGEPVQLYLVTARRVTRINLTEFFRQLANEDELYCHIAFVVNSATRSELEDIVSLVPMAEPIKCFTGLQEIKSITSFVKNSKFGVEKFFGFEEEADEQMPSAMNREDVIESLHNYEIEFSSPFVLNAVRVDKKGNIGLQKLQEVYAGWQRLAEAIGEVDFEEGDEEMDEQEEAFETGGNCETEDPRKVEEEEDDFRDDDFDD